VLKSGYMMKPAKATLMGSGWRKRWVVLTAGTVSYVNDKHVIAAEVKALQTAQEMRLTQKIPLGFDAPSRVASEEDEVLRKENAQFNLQLCTTKMDGLEKGVSRDARFCFRVISPTQKKEDALVLQAESYAGRAEWIKAIQTAIADTVLGTGGAAPKLNHTPSKESSESLGGGRARQVSMPSGHRPPRGRKESTAALPAGWEAHADDEGNVFYYNAQTGESTYEHPAAPALPAAPLEEASAPLLAGWSAFQDDDGATYYHNAAKGETTYTMPTDATPQAQRQARVVFSYTAGSEAELSLNEGDIVTIVNTELGEWWSGVFKGKTGLFPANYVEEIASVS